MPVDVMNNCPLAWRNKKFLKRYQYYIKERRATTAIVGRLCPMGCKFCESRLSGLALYTPKRVEAELIELNITVVLTPLCIMMISLLLI
ncbi:MAG: hypothetical protein IBV53_07070 [Candidatus Atribacteria bacterium]